MIPTRYLTTDEVLAMHAVLIDRFGGAKGLRDQAALESAVARPQVGYYVDVLQEACALLESLAINHPFLNGNKRIAFAPFDVFLRLNGYRIQTQPMGRSIGNGWSYSTPANFALPSWKTISAASYGCLTP